MLGSRGINATHGITTTEHDMCIKFGYKQLITFGIPQCSPAGTAKQILIQFWQDIHKAKKRSKKEWVLAGTHTCKKPSNDYALKLQLNIYFEGVMEVERLACLSERCGLKTFPLPNICLCYSLTKLTMNVIQ